MPRPNLYFEERIPSPLLRTWLAFKASPMAMLGLYLMGFLLLAALVGPWIAPHGPSAQNTEALLVPPSWDQSGHVDYFFGTDDLGRDLLSRLLHGARLTFGSAILVVLAAAVVGVSIGALSGMMKGIKSSVLHHLLDTLLSIPSLLLAILIVAIQGPGLDSALIAVWLALVPQFVRATHNAIADELEKEYVIAARLDGVPPTRLMLDVIFPNVTEGIVHQLALALSAAILDISALGFLGLGAQAPLPEWGTMLSGAMELAYRAPWTVTLPGLAILVSVLATNLVGDGLRKALGARLEQ
ncbi:ABC transporter permease subunit [Gallaecimonas sp. GXIMD4217]|uniref:ABC transporter permease subunit n=1 Tax=Gallaecimonas sp. GXIMD4217 TaxID=3131927 RepID=UPI00311B4154